MFIDAAPLRDLWPEEAEWPWRRIEALCVRFTEVFPEVRYEVYWDARLPNAQAFLGPYGKTMRIYGGLARNRRIGLAGLALTFAHETGHHLADGARHPAYVSLASEERAHEWAVDEGLPGVFGREIAARYSSAGKAQLQEMWRKYRKQDSIDPFARN